MADLIWQLGNLLLRAIDIYRLVLVAYFLMSWLPGAYQSTLGQLLRRFCEPYVGFFRQFIPSIGMISLAGLAALVSLTFIEYGVATIMEFLVQLAI